MNWYGTYTLFGKEVWRFMKVAAQTVFTPVITVLLYLLVFSSVLSDHVEVYANVSYTTFLVPGLIMMSIIQNAFANTSSSLFQSKMTGNVVFMLVAPLSSFEIFLAYVGAAVVRGLMVGLGVWIAGLWFAPLPLAEPLVLLVFATLGSVVLGSLGLIAALQAEKWDHVAAFQNFVILPFSFLSGVFYSVHSLPPFWTQLSQFNPFFYMIDGFRYGFLGQSDTHIGLSLAIVLLATVAVSAWGLYLLNIGYRMRS